MHHFSCDINVCFNIFYKTLITLMMELFIISILSFNIWTCVIGDALSCNLSSDIWSGRDEHVASSVIGDALSCNLSSDIWSGRDEHVASSVIGDALSCNLSSDIWSGRDEHVASSVIGDALFISRLQVSSEIYSHTSAKTFMSFVQ